MLRLIMVGSDHPTDYRKHRESCRYQAINPAIAPSRRFTFCNNLSLIVLLCTHNPAEIAAFES